MPQKPEESDVPWSAEDVAAETEYLVAATKKLEDALAKKAEATQQLQTTQQKAQQSGQDVGWNQGWSNVQNLLPKDQQARVRDFLSADLGTRENPWQDISQAQKSSSPRYGLKEIVNRDAIPVEGLPPDEFDRVNERERQYEERAQGDIYTKHERRYDVQPKSKREKLAEDKAQKAQEKEKLDEDREDWRKQADKSSETWKDRRDKEREREARRAEQEAEHMRQLRYKAFENVLDEGLNTLSEKPISPGGGAASGSNMGRLFRGLKNTGGRLYNALQGRRFGKQFTHKFSGKGKGVGGGARKPPGGGKGIGGLFGGGGGKPPIPPVGGAAGAAGAAGAGGAAGAAGAGGAAGGGAGIAAAGGPVGVAVVGAMALGVATLEASKQVYEFARAQEDVVRKLAKVGGQQAVSVAKLDVERQFRDIKTAQETGDSSAALLNSISKFEDKLQPLESLLTNIANTVGGRLLDMVGEGLSIIQPVIDILKDIYKALGGKVDSQSQDTPFKQIDDIERRMAQENRPMWPQPRNAGN